MIEMLFFIREMDNLKEELTKRNFIQSLNALIYAEEKHDGQYRHPKVLRIPYIMHPVTMAYHALALNIVDDDILSAIFLHDVVEDCGVQIEELPVNENVKEIVKLVTKSKTNFSNDEYYKKISENVKACIVKCIDRCHNVSCMAEAFSTEKLCKYIDETETYFPKLFEKLKQYDEYKNISWLIEYQIGSLIKSAKRIIESERIN